MMSCSLPPSPSPENKISKGGVNDILMKNFMNYLNPKYKHLFIFKIV